jgi:hypothetical protein
LQRYFFKEVEFGQINQKIDFNLIVTLIIQIELKLKEYRLASSRMATGKREKYGTIYQRME